MIPFDKARWWPLLLLLGLCVSAEAREYRRALPGYRFEFPRDHFSRLALTARPSLPDQELDTRKSTQVIYWEGSVNVTGTYEGNPVTGHGYVELTGYAGKFNQRI